ncbi:hypothetical protein INQ51_17075 [Maribellus sp. CM-23]|uniref:FISUMP domain-containing protein n=1 Tax=Maribellus sp. CM-23 TaxID=2781026 RepID=UPI001F1879BD|nr:FISUMP domain-containing protein [Maribellus sp. CM-23]MCE4566035.1 hypothetical protein [Maribellus sp. CM-23]
MKANLKTVSTIIFFLIAFASSGQTVYTKNDTIQLEQDSVVLKVNNHRGQIQWQYSRGAYDWENIEGATNDSLFIGKIDSSGFYRAKIIDNNCNPILSDSTYILRKLSNEEEFQMIANADGINNDVIFFAPDSTTTQISIIDTTGTNDIVEIQTTLNLDSIKIGSLLVDTTGMGKIIYVTDYVKEKSGGDLIKKMIEGFQVGIDFLITDDTLSYSSPTNRTKNWWDNQLKLNNSGKVKKMGFNSYLQGMEETVEKEYLQLDFSNTDLWNIEDDNGHLNIRIEEGYLKYNPSIDFYAIYKPAVVATAAISPYLLDLLGDYLLKGTLDKLKVITYNDFDLRLKLNIDANLTQNINPEPVKIAQYWYAIPAGPILVSVKTELVARLVLESSGDINIQPDYELKKNLVLGINVNKQNEEFEKEFIHDHYADKSSSISYTGNFNFSERLEIVPSVEVYIMGLVGLNGELIPYQEFNFNASISNEHPLIFDTSLDIGVDGHASFDISAFHFDKGTSELFRGEWEISKRKNLYHAPAKLSYYSGNNQTGLANTTLLNSLKTRVYDSNNNTINNFPVFYDVISGGGSIDLNVPKTNSSGIASANWTLGNSGTQKVIARLTKADVTQKVAEINFNANIDYSSSPVVSTSEASEISETSATLNGNVSSDGGSPITQRGFYWSRTNQNPDSGDNVVIVSGTTGIYSKMISGLESGITYYFKAFAINSKGISLGTTVEFNTNEATSGTFTDPRDNHVYKWVKIGDQIWFAENLQYGSTSGSYPQAYIYGDPSIHGYLYTDRTKYCPSGWHTPSDLEWQQLEKDLGMSETEVILEGYRGEGIGDKLKDSTSFNATLSGYRVHNSTSGYYLGLNDVGRYWTTTSAGINGNSEYWIREINVNNSMINRTHTTYWRGYCIRCVKNK